MTPERILAICKDEWPVLRWRWSHEHRAAFGRGGAVEVHALRPPGKLYVYIDTYAHGRFVAGSPPVAGSRALRSALRQARKAATS